MLEALRPCSTSLEAPPVPGAQAVAFIDGPVVILTPERALDMPAVADAPRRLAEERAQIGVSPDRSKPRVLLPGGPGTRVLPAEQRDLLGRTRLVSGCTRGAWQVLGLELAVSDTNNASFRRSCTENQRHRREHGCRSRTPRPSLEINGFPRTRRSRRR